jgi:Carboxypeptidase regulatory-like domain
MHSLRLYVAGAALLLVPFVRSASSFQMAGATQDAPATPWQKETQQPGASSSNSGSSSSKGKHTHAQDFLIRGTVFQPSSLAFPGVRLRIRRAKENKFRWETFTNSRGEFAVRVPQGLQYELVIHLKGFADQTREVNATSGISEDNVVFRMQAMTGEKK